MNLWGRTRHATSQILLLRLNLLLMCCLLGCRSVAPIHVWSPSKLTTPSGSKVAIAALSIDPTLATILENAVIEQRPAARSDLAVLTSRQLLEAAPVRLASTASALGMIGSDLEAIRSAQAAGADWLLFGQVYSCDIDWNDESEALNKRNASGNQNFFQRLGLQKDLGPNRHIVMSWNVFEVSTGKSIGSQQFRLTSHEVLELYPDLQHLAERPGFQLITAAARETWRSVAPTVEKTEVRLAAPWFQPGSLRVLFGVHAAKRGQWQVAEGYWSSVASSWLPTPAAHHNLAVAMAAREDFTSAKQELLKARGPLSARLPGETLVWLDHQHRHYNQAHQLGDPPEGWAFPTAIERTVESNSMRPVNEDELPWWAGLPGLRYQPK